MKKIISYSLVFCLLFQATVQAVNYRERDLPTEADIGIFAKTYYHTAPVIPQTKAQVIDLTIKLCRTKDDTLRSRSPHLPQAQALAEEITAAQQMAAQPWSAALFEIWMQIHDNKNRCRHAAAAKKCFAPNMSQQDKQVLLWLITILNDPKLTDDFVTAFTRIPTIAPAQQGPVPPLTRANFLQNCADVLVRVDAQRRKHILRGTFKIAREGMSGPHVYHIMRTLDAMPSEPEQATALDFMAHAYRPNSLGVDLHDLTHLFMRELPTNRAPIAQAMRVLASRQMTGRDMIGLFAHLASMQANGSLTPFLEINSSLALQDMPPDLALQLLEDVKRPLAAPYYTESEGAVVMGKVLRRTFAKGALPEDRVTITPQLIQAFNSLFKHIRPVGAWRDETVITSSASVWQELDATLKPLYPLLPHPHDRASLIMDLWGHHAYLLSLSAYQKSEGPKHLARLLLAKEFINKEMDPQTILAIIHAFSSYTPQSNSSANRGWGVAPSPPIKLTDHLDHLRELRALASSSPFLGHSAFPVCMLLHKDPLSLASPAVRDIAELAQLLEREHAIIHRLFPAGQVQMPEFLSLYDVRLGHHNEAQVAFLQDTFLPALPALLPYKERYELLKRIFTLFANSTEPNLKIFFHYFPKAREAIHAFPWDTVEKINFILGGNNWGEQANRYHAKVISHCAPVFQPWMSFDTIKAVVDLVRNNLTQKPIYDRDPFEAYLWLEVATLFPLFITEVRTDQEAFMSLLGHFLKSTPGRWAKDRWTQKSTISVEESVYIVHRLKAVLPSTLSGEQLLTVLNIFCQNSIQVRQRYSRESVRPSIQDIWGIYETLISPRMQFENMETFFNDLTAVIENYQGSWPDIPALLPSLLELTHADTSAHDIQTIFRQLLSLRSNQRLSVGAIQQRATLVRERLTQEVMEGHLFEAQRLERTLQLIDDPHARRTPQRAQPVAGSDIIGQEAIWRQREKFHKEYEEAATRSPTAQVIGRHLPHPQQQAQLREALDRVAQLIAEARQDGALSSTQKFQLTVAEKAFPYILTRQSFQPKSSMPTFAQMVGLLYNLTRMVNPDLRPAITYRISQDFTNFQNTFPALAGNFATAGQFLANSIGRQWVNDLWQFYQGHDVTFWHLGTRFSPNQRRWMRDLPYYLVTPIRDEIIAGSITHTFTPKDTAPPLTHYAFANIKALFPDITASYNETQGPAFMASPAGKSFMGFVKKKLWEHHDGPLSGEKDIVLSHPLLTAQQEGWLANLYHSLPRRFYNLDNNIQRHLTQLKLQSVAAFTEACFMCLRSHCRGLDNQAERDSPACTDGGYLHFLRGVLEQLRLKYDLTGDSVLDAVEFLQCS